MADAEPLPESSCAEAEIDVSREDPRSCTVIPTTGDDDDDARSRTEDVITGHRQSHTSMVECLAGEISGGESNGDEGSDDSGTLRQSLEEDQSGAMPEDDKEERREESEEEEEEEEEGREESKEEEKEEAKKEGGREKEEETMKKKEEQEKRREDSEEEEKVEARKKEEVREKEGEERRKEDVRKEEEEEEEEGKEESKEEEEEKQGERREEEEAARKEEVREEEEERKDEGREEEEEGRKEEEEKEKEEVKKEEEEEKEKMKEEERREEEEDARKEEVRELEEKRKEEVEEGRKEVRRKVSEKEEKESKEEEERKEEVREEEEEEEDTSDTTGDEEEEEVDPRVAENLEIMNQSCAEVNRLENELDEARSKYRSTFQTSSQRMEELGGKIKKSIQRARQYFDLLDRAKLAQNEALRAARQFQSANGNYRAAMEMASLAEKGLQDDTSARTRTLSSAWQETLSHAVQRLTEAEREKTRTETEHNQKAAICTQLESQIHGLEKKYKRSIAKARPYFETKAELELKLQQLKQNVWDLQHAIGVRKTRYSEALRCLETVSTEIHESRRNRKKLLLQYPREPGVGAETDSVGSSISDNATIERGVFSTSSNFYPDEDDDDDGGGEEGSDFEAGEVFSHDTTNSSSDLRKRALVRSLSKRSMTSTPPKQHHPQPQEEDQERGEALDDSGCACSQASGRCSLFSRSISGTSELSDGLSCDSAPDSPFSSSPVSAMPAVVAHCHHHHHHHRHHHHHHHNHPAVSEEQQPGVDSTSRHGSVAPSLVDLACGDLGPKGCNSCACEPSSTKNPQCDSSDCCVSSSTSSKSGLRDGGGGRVGSGGSSESAVPATITTTTSAGGVQNQSGNPAWKKNASDVDDFPQSSQLREAGDGSAQEDSPKEPDSSSSSSSQGMMPYPQTQASPCSQKFSPSAASSSPSLPSTSTSTPSPALQQDQRGPGRCQELPVKAAASVVVPAGKSTKVAASAGDGVTQSASAPSVTSQVVGGGGGQVKKAPLRRTDGATHRPLQGIMLLNPSDLAASSFHRGPPPRFQ